MFRFAGSVKGGKATARRTPNGKSRNLHIPALPKGGNIMSTLNGRLVQALAATEQHTGSGQTQYPAARKKPAPEYGRGRRNGSRERVGEATSSSLVKNARDGARQCVLRGEAERCYGGTGSRVTNIGNARQRQSERDLARSRLNQRKRRTRRRANVPDGIVAASRIRANSSSDVRQIERHCVRSASESSEARNVHRAGRRPTRAE